MTPTASRHTVSCWGTVIRIEARDPVDAAVIDAVFDWFRLVDARFSTWRGDSEISRIGAGTLGVEEASADVREVLLLADAMRTYTGGAFDIGVGADPRVTRWEGLGVIDPSGIVKGWALKRAATMLHDAGVHNFAVNAGGDVIVAGHAAAGEAWRVGIQHPYQRDRVACTVAVTDGGVATSGRYERGDHIVDPRTGTSATALVAATVVADSLSFADAVATALVALGADAPRWLEDHPDVAAFLIDPAGMTTSTAAFDACRAD
ncbi:MAG TPA: FAD:protein FMN transferase [Acidimicrobiales bacterium]|nr:FAD:protein FMN transferase [Acidimicrobiales bacterium]